MFSIKRPVAGKSTEKGYIQAVPIFLKSDLEVKSYFENNQEELDIITDRNIIILMPAEIRDGNIEGVVAALMPKENVSTRFPRLKIADLPCLWLEDGLGGQSFIKLPSAPAEIRQLLRVVASVASETRDARVVKKRVEQAMVRDLSDRSYLPEFLDGSGNMTKSAEKLAALITGVTFVSIIIVIALFIPDPSSFQYTVFRIVLSLAAAGFVSMTPGFIDFKISNWLRAGGALAVFAIVFFYSPAALVAIARSN